MPVFLAAVVVTIRIYNYAGVPPAELTAARAGAEHIFQDAGFALQWRICRSPNDDAGEACTEVLRDTGEFVLRLQSTAGGDVPSQTSLGDSLIDGRSGGGVLITIDPRRVHTIATQARAEPALLLGRAIAHEVGHLLIRTPTHSAHGLMRPLWTQRELRRNTPADWLFSGDQIALMKRTLAAGMIASVKP